MAEVLTVVASGPESMVVSGGTPGAGGSIVQVCVAGVGSTLPEKSTARTSNVCVPRPRPVQRRGLVHGAKSAASVLSRRHSNVTEVALSVPVKRNVADVVRSSGSVGMPSRSWSSGATVSEGRPAGRRRTRR